MSLRDAISDPSISSHCEVFSLCFSDVARYRYWLNFWLKHGYDFYVLSVGPGSRCVVAVCPAGSSLPFDTAALRNVDPLRY